MNRYSALGLNNFLRRYQGMDVRPVNCGDLCLEGIFDFSARTTDHDEITDSFRLRIVVPEKFSKGLPTVDELDGRIPRKGSYHVNPNGTLCLGSRLRLLLAVAKDPTLIGFASNCLVPYLFAISRKLIEGGGLVFGELDHGSSGEITDYMAFFGLKTAEQVKRAVLCLGIKKRRANKLTCPCEGGRRLGVCSFNRRLRRLRQLADSKWFRGVALDLMKESTSRHYLNSAVRAALSLN